MKVKEEYPQRKPFLLWKLNQWTIWNECPAITLIIYIATSWVSRSPRNRILHPFHLFNILKDGANLTVNSYVFYFKKQVLRWWLSLSGPKNFWAGLFWWVQYNVGLGLMVSWYWNNVKPLSYNWAPCSWEPIKLRHKLQSSLWSGPATLMLKQVWPDLCLVFSMICWAEEYWETLARPQCSHCSPFGDVILNHPLVDLQQGKAAGIIQ